MSMNTTVHMLDGRIAVYSLAADDALIAAHAQFVLKDWNTWDYARKYAGLRELIRDGKRPGSRKFGDMIAVEEKT